MAKTSLPEAGKLQYVWEGILKWTAFSVLCLQLALGILMYLLPDEVTAVLFKTEKWVVLILFLASLTYLLYTRLKAPRLMFRIRSFLKGLFCPEFIVLLVFFVWSIFCTMSADSRYTANFFQINDSSLFDTFVSFFIVFTMACVFRGDSARKLTELLFHVFCALLTVFMVYVLYVICKPGIINLPGDVQIGLAANARLCVNCNPNTTGAVAAVILMMCLYMVVTRKGLLRWLYLAAFLVHYLVLVMSNSRTCIVSAGVAVGAVVGKLCYDALKNKILWQRILFALLTAVAAAGLIIGLRRPVLAAHEAISHFLELTGKDSALVIREAEMTFGMRTELWVGALKSVFQDAKHFFFGVTPAGVVSEVSIWAESHRKLYTHNQFLEIAVAHGVPGLVMYLVWLGMIARSCVRVVSGKIRDMHKGMLVFAAMILMLVISNLMEATLLYYRWFMETVFFLLCGMITYKIRT